MRLVGYMLETWTCFKHGFLIIFDRLIKVTFFNSLLLQKRETFEAEIIEGFVCLAKIKRAFFSEMDGTIWSLSCSYCVLMSHFLVPHCPDLNLTFERKKKKDEEEEERRKN
jgi:hypothetical protein